MNQIDVKHQLNNKFDTYFYIILILIILELSFDKYYQNYRHNNWTNLSTNRVSSQKEL